MPYRKLLPVAQLVWSVALGSAANFACSRYPASPVPLVAKFVKATQDPGDDAKAYLSADLQKSLSMKGLKYTFGSAVVAQSVPEAAGKHAILVKTVRLGAGRVVIVSNMRVVVARENGRWVITQLIAGINDTGDVDNNAWLTAPGIPLG